MGTSHVHCYWLLVNVLKNVKSVFIRSVFEAISDLLGCNKGDKILKSYTLNMSIRPIVQEPKYLTKKISELID